MLGSHAGSKCQRQGRWEAGNRPRKSTERPNEPSLPRNRGQGELSLTRQDGGHTLLREEGSVNRKSRLHPIDAIGVNGVHAVVVAPVLVRIELFRSGRTCQLLITKHEPGKVENGRRPPLENRVLFRGVNGLVDLERLRTSNDLAGGSAMPEFWSRAGEVLGIPAVFAAAVGAATKGVSCVGCSHSHYLVTPFAAVGVPGASV